MDTQRYTHRAATPADAVPPQTRRRATPPVEHRIVRQIAAIDAWNTARRMRESVLETACMSRHDREAASRQADVLRRTQQAIAAWAAKELAREAGPMLFPTATAVIAHRHAWFADKLAKLLEARGVDVVECTDNGGDALGAVIAEQPSIVLAGDRLAMMPGAVLLAEARLFAPATVCAVQASDPQQAGAWLTKADAVFLRHHGPGDVADALSALCRTPVVQPERA